MSLLLASMRPRRVPRNHKVSGNPFFLLFARFNEAEARASESQARPTVSSPSAESFNEAEARASESHGRRGMGWNFSRCFNEAEARASESQRARTPRLPPSPRGFNEAEARASESPKRDSATRPEGGRASMRPRRVPRNHFLCAGWRRCGESKRGLAILEILPPETP